MADSPANAPRPAAVAPASQPPLSRLASPGLHASSPPLLKRRPSAALEPPALTGAAALADQQRLAADEAQQRQRPPPPPPTQAATPPQTTINPAISSLNALRNGGNPISRPFSRPPAAPVATMSSARPQLPSITQIHTTAEPMSLDPQQTTSPTSISSADDLGPKAPGSKPDDLRQPPSEPDAASEERPRPAAMTYPGPRHLEAANGPSRQMSLPTPGSASKSPSKKHKCPHCSTEFTRHHNLKSHLLTHSQEKPYACSTCHARFRRLHDLKRHNKLHTGERPHICDRCGRKFARGDALARHNKGPGGCAGRRGSMDEDYIEGESGYGDSMEGVVYNDGAAGDDQAEYDRRKSEPGPRPGAPTLQTHTDAASSPFRQHSSTHPGSSTLAAQNRNQFAQPVPSPSHLTPGGGGASSYSSQLNAGPGVFAQGGMTESPKPLSPGQADTRRLSAANEGSYFRGRSPSHPQFSQSSQYAGRGAGRGTPPVVSLPLPAMQHGHTTQLPSIKAATGQYAPPGPPGSTSNAGSSVSSSAHQSSISSMRDISSLTGQHAPAGVPADVNLYEHVKYLERQVAQLKEDSAVSERHYETKIARIMDENRELRAQLGTVQQGRA